MKLAIHHLNQPEKLRVEKCLLKFEHVIIHTSFCLYEPELAPKQTVPNIFLFEQHLQHYSKVNLSITLTIKTT